MKKLDFKIADRNYIEEIYSLYATDDEFKLSLEEIEEHIKNQEFLLLLLDNVIVASATVSKNKIEGFDKYPFIFTDEGKVSYLDNVFVKKENRRQGLGNLILECVKGYCDKRGDLAIQCKVKAKNNIACIALERNEYDLNYKDKINDEVYNVYESILIL